MKSFYLVLIACFIQGINGKKYDTECEDDSQHVCENQESRCFIPSVQFNCPKTCGVCEAQCKDYNDNCYQENFQCGNNVTISNECPKTCATCDVCEDLIDTSICQTSLKDCHNNYMRYACRKTCLYCLDPCNNVGNDDFCKLHTTNRICEKNDVFKKMCRKSCNFCELEQC